MVSTDPIADMLTRIRNAINVRKNEVDVPYSRIKESIAKLLKDNGFITNVSVSGEGIGKKLTITINPAESNAVITEIVRMSKPGRRHYASVDDIPQVKRGRGIVIVSTSQGVMTGADARAKRLGGELICKVY
jgi:small subunit ribosomal protein S8